MEKYKNEKYVKSQIIGQSRHQFIYGYNNNYRSQFLQSFETEYPVIMDSEKPVALYFDSLGLPAVNTDLKDKDPYIIKAMNREYVSFAIASRMIERTMEKESSNLDTRLSRLISLSNIGRSKGFSEIKTSDELLAAFKASRDFYLDNYEKYLKAQTDSVDIGTIAIPFIQLEMFTEQLKRGLGINSYFAVLIDNRKPVSIFSTRAINNFLGSRINKDLSFKVATEPDKWPTYKDENGQLVQAIHDYGEVELDECNSLNCRVDLDYDFEI